MLTILMAFAMALAMMIATAIAVHNEAQTDSLITIKKSHWNLPR